MDLKEEIIKLKEELDVTLVAHFYQRDEVFELADITGDSLELAKKVMLTDSKYVVFCGVGFMGESVKVMSPDKTVLMPKIACCAMARMIDEGYFEQNLKKINDAGIPNENILPITYINSSAAVKAKVGQMGGMVCTSSNAYKIIEKGLESGKKIFFGIIVLILAVPGQVLMIPNYIILAKMGLLNSLWSLILPASIKKPNVFSQTLIPTFFQSGSLYVGISKIR